MARKSSLLPSYLLHKPTGQARCRIDGRDVYLGPFGSESSRIKYGQLVAKLAGGVPLDPLAGSKSGRSLPRLATEIDPGPTVGELCLAFMRHAETHYIKNGVPTSEIHILKSVIRPLNQLYGIVPAKEFGPLAMKAVRALMVEKGWCDKSWGLRSTQWIITGLSAILCEAEKASSFEAHQFRRVGMVGGRVRNLVSDFPDASFKHPTANTFTHRFCGRARFRIAF